MPDFIPTVYKTATFNRELTFWALFRTPKNYFTKLYLENFHLSKVNSFFPELSPPLMKNMVKKT